DALMLGEIGLHEGERIKSTTKEQDALFEVFLEAAEKCNKIMNCHFRNGLEPKGLEVMESYGIKRGIFHSYSGLPEMIEKITENGFYISYGSPSFRNLSKKHREYFEERIPKVHEDFLIIEIDVLARGKDFKPPSEIFPAIVKTIARMRKTTPEEIVALNQKNVLRLIGDDPKLKPMVDLLEP
ncbi:MAG: TatD family hydrolase, partial [Candidatus Thorarchaeota archaeon]